MRSIKSDASFGSDTVMRVCGVASILRSSDGRSANIIGVFDTLTTPRSSTVTSASYNFDEVDAQPTIVEINSIHIAVRIENDPAFRNFPVIAWTSAGQR